MDLHEILSFLHAEKEKLDRVISSLEELQAVYSNTTTALRRRRRKFMSEKERREVSGPNEKDSG
jgi:hypothetical protein